MAAARMPHPIRNHPQMTRTASEVFWSLAIGVIAAYVFFAVLGAFSPGDVLGVTIAVAVLTVLWLVRSLLARRGGAGPGDRRAVSARERRGF